MKRLVKFGHQPPKRPQHCPYAQSLIHYGKKSQDTLLEDGSPAIGKKVLKSNQEVVGSFIYHSRATDTTILTALTAIAGEQVKPAEKALGKFKQFLNYMLTHPDARIRFQASDMVLNVHSDASHLSAPKARSRAGGHFFLGSLSKDKAPIILNELFYFLCTIFKTCSICSSRSRARRPLLEWKQAEIIKITLK